MATDPPEQPFTGFLPCAVRVWPEGREPSPRNRGVLVFFDGDVKTKKAARYLESLLLDDDEEED